jgi:predicted phosphoribosyltransferase
MYSVTIFGNVEQCRTEAEISSSEGIPMAVVYQTSDEWHVDPLVEHMNLSGVDFQAAVKGAKESLEHYVNRRGENPPENATGGAFALWLMVKDDGTTTGVNMKAPQGPD